MEAATAPPRAGYLSTCMAGLQAGMLGACWMLLWLGLTAKWQQRSFWTSANLMASVFYGSDSIHSGFAWSTLSGVALYLLLYSGLGVLFALLLKPRVHRARTTVLLGMLFAVVWYYVSFRMLWKAAMPLVALLHTEQPTVLGHVLYGAILGRFPTYLNRLEPAPEQEPAPPNEPESAPAEEAQQDSASTET